MSNAPSSLVCKFGTKHPLKACDDLTGFYADKWAKRITPWAKENIRVYNDYQDSGMVNLVNRQNVFKKFRNYKVNFPRDKGSRDRIRSAWGFAEFEFNNPNGNKLILHDISIFFTQH